MIYAESEHAGNSVLLDQLCKTHCVSQLCKYVDDDFRIIISERDARDIYCFMKESSQKCPYPDNVEEFVDFYKGMHRFNDFCDSRIVNVRFEDLVYDYEN